MKIKVNNQTIETDILNGYRRVKVGRTHEGDLAYVPACDRNPAMPFEWEPVTMPSLVSEFPCVIRQIKG